MGFATELLIGASLNTHLMKGNDNYAKSILIKAAHHVLSQDRMLSAVPVSEGKKMPYWAGIKDPLKIDSIVVIDQCPRSFTSMSSRIEYINSCYSTGQLDIEDKTTSLWKLVLSAHMFQSILYFINSLMWQYSKLPAISGDYPICVIATKIKLQ